MFVSTEPDSEIIFFLGAGASVGAGVDTFGLVDAFREKIASQSENLRAVNKILEILREIEGKELIETYGWAGLEIRF